MRARQKKIALTSLLTTATLVLLVGSAPLVYAQSASPNDGGVIVGELSSGARPTIEFNVQPSKPVGVGDAVTARIQVTARAGDDISIPPQDFPGFEIVSKRIQPTTSASGNQRVYEMQLVALEPGEHTLGPIRVRVVTKDGEIGEVQTSSHRVRVNSLIANEPNAQLKPATAPLSVMQHDYTLLWVVGGLLAIALTVWLTLLFAKWWRARKKAATPPPPPRPPWEVAFENLARLGQQKTAMIAEGKVVEWIDGISDAVRAFLGDRYDFEGLESTSDEIVMHLERLHPSGISTLEVQMFLGQCDLVKFANVSANEADCDAALAKAYQLVQAGVPPLPTPGTHPAVASTNEGVNVRT